MATRNTSNQFYFALVSFLLHAKQQVVTLSAEFGLTGIQALTLLQIETIDTPSMSAFGKLYGCDPSNITGIVDGLEQKGLVSRRPHPSDRRTKLIHLEQAGKNMQDKIVKRLAESSDHLFDRLNKTERKQLEDLVCKLAPRQN